MKWLRSFEVPFDSFIRDEKSSKSNFGIDSEFFARNGDIDVTTFLEYAGDT